MSVILSVLCLYACKCVCVSMFLVNVWKCQFVRFECTLVNICIYICSQLFFFPTKTIAIGPKNLEPSIDFRVSRCFLVVLSLALSFVHTFAPFLLFVGCAHDYDHVHVHALDSHGHTLSLHIISSSIIRSVFPTIQLTSSWDYSSGEGPKVCENSNLCSCSREAKV